MKETRRSLYNSESGVKKMAVGHHLGERSHTTLLYCWSVKHDPFVLLECQTRPFCIVGVSISTAWSGGVWSGVCVKRERGVW